MQRPPPPRERLAPKALPETPAGGRPEARPAGAHRRVPPSGECSARTFAVEGPVVVVPASGRSDVLVAAHWTGELRRVWSQGARAEAAQ